MTEYNKTASRTKPAKPQALSGRQNHQPPVPPGNDKKPLIWRLLRAGFYCLLATFVLSGVALVSVSLWVWQELPEAGILQDIHLQQPLRIYSSDDVLIGEFGSKFRQPVQLETIPRHVINAFLASEDARFLEHSGVDFIGLARAAMVVISTGRLSQGASTITMQVARNYFLNREKTLIRKLRELLLALKIERELSKQQILELYLNRIFFGYRAYGIEAAAQVYYGKKASQLSIAEAAMIAGLPQRPSRDNPVRNPKNSLQRRNNYVLPRMFELKMINAEQLEIALQTPEVARIHSGRASASAEHFVEMVRLALAEKYDELFFEFGYKVYTTLNSRYQQQAVSALRQGLQDYEMRQGYSGPVGHIDDYSAADEDKPVTQILTELAEEQVLPADDLSYAAVVDVEVGAGLRLVTAKKVIFELSIDDLKPVLKITRVKPDKLDSLFPLGSIVIIQALSEDKVRLAQMPKAQGALYSMDPETGAIQAMVGGYGFVNNHFNRATQANRQVGSLFKPFLYSAALANGYNPSTIINDTNITFDDVGLEEDWRPSNYSNRVFGPTLLRDALVYSRNLVSIKLLEDLGTVRVRRWMRKFGFEDTRQIPKNLTMALGSGIFSPEELSLGLAVLANGGHLLKPWFIERIENSQGRVIYRQDFSVACLECHEDWQKSPDFEFVDDAEPGQQGDEIATHKPTGLAVEISDTDTSLAEKSNGLSATEVELLSSREETFLRFDPEHSNDERVVHRVSQAPQTLDPRLALLVSSFMNDVIRRGTARRAYRALKRVNLYGKTGTTNENIDAWFAGFHQHLLTTVWVGKDDNITLGRNEAGGRTALPIWIEYMRTVLPELEVKQMPLTDGIQLRRVNRKTGQITNADDKDSYLEYFLEENLAAAESGGNGDAPSVGHQQSEALEELF